MTIQINFVEWQSIAPYYDLYFGDRTKDIPFWISIATQFGSPVLELACGTGRLMLPIAEAGNQITGLDISASMLNEANRKRSLAEGSVQKNMTLILGDACRFQIPDKRFKMIMSPWGLPAVSRMEQSSFMHSVRSNLLPGGHFILDVINTADGKIDKQHFGIQGFKQFPQERTTILRQVYSQKFSKTRLHHQLFVWDITSSGNHKRIVTQRVEYMYSKQDLESLLSRHGFILDEEYGDYDRRPWSKESARLLIICHKK